MNQILILGGPPGAGKTAVAQAVCERYDRMLRIDAATLRQWVCAGYRSPDADDAQAAEQRLLAVRNASAIARESAAARYAAVIEDAAFAADLAAYREALGGAGAIVHAVTLLPGAGALSSRLPAGADPALARELHARYRAEIADGALPGAVLDTTADPGPHATAERLMDLIATGGAVLLRPGA